MAKMEELKEMLCEELDKIAKKGELSTGSLDVIDKLTHSIKSIDTIMAMEDAGYSERGYSRDMSYNDGRMMRGDSYERGNSYARGRGSNAKRDSRGRYSSEYAMDDLHDKLQDMMEEASNEREREAIRKVMNMI